MNSYRKRLLSDGFSVTAIGNSHVHHAEPGLLRGMVWSPIGSPLTSKSILQEIPSPT